MYRTSWTKEQRAKAKERGTALYLLGVETETHRAETSGATLDLTIAPKLFRFVILLGGGVPPRVAFTNAFEGGD